MRDDPFLLFLFLLEFLLFLKLSLHLPASFSSILYLSSICRSSVIDLLLFFLSLLQCFFLCFSFRLLPVFIQLFLRKNSSHGKQRNQKHLKYCVETHKQTQMLHSTLAYKGLGVWGLGFGVWGL